MMKSRFLIFNLILGMALTTVISSPSYANDVKIYQQKLQNIDNSTQNCTERQKNQDGNIYTICSLKGKIVRASEGNIEAAAGLEFWFQNGKVVAIRRSHEDTTFFYRNHRLEAELFTRSDGKTIVKTKFTKSERQELENLARNGFKSIFRVFQ